MRTTRRRPKLCLLWQIPLGPLILLCFSIFYGPVLGPLALLYFWMELGPKPPAPPGSETTPAP